MKIDLHNVTLDQAERILIEHRIKICDGNRKRAAKELGITDRTLRNKMAKWGYIKNEMGRYVCNPRPTEF